MAGNLAVTLVDAISLKDTLKGVSIKDILLKISLSLKDKSNNKLPQRMKKQFLDVRSKRTECFTPRMLTGSSELG